MDKKDAWGSLAEKLLFVGITGGIASGKSEFAAEIENLGGFIIDADKIGRELLNPDCPVSKKIKNAFGDSILCKDGTIDRKELAEIAFSDFSAKEKLDQITHPLIFDEMIERARCYNLERNERHAMVFVDSALIVDTGIAGIFDIIVVIISDEETRVERLVQNRAYSEEEARNRINSQVSDAQRLIHADIVVKNDKGLEELKASAKEVWGELLKKVNDL